MIEPSGFAFGHFIAFDLVLHHTITQDTASYIVIVDSTIIILYALLTFGGEHDNAMSRQKSKMNSVPKCMSSGGVTAVFFTFKTDIMRY